MGRILEAGNKNFADQIKARRESFCENALFFGVWNKSLKPPMGLDRTGPAIALMKKTDVLEPSEDPNTFLQIRPITSPVILDSTNLLLAVGKIPLI
ncbi:hypothetical protein KUCAC02_029460 [Chaenocephalus aceratus]|nr:hypothetical protein KUCAC02_029460 [Chaenocephalus aceratus]